MTEINEIHSRERLAKLETNVEHIDYNLQQVIKNTQVQHDTLFKLTDAVQQISVTLTEYKILETKVTEVTKEMDVMKTCKDRLDKIEKQNFFLKAASIGILLGILFTILPSEAYPSILLKLMGVAV